MFNQERVDLHAIIGNVVPMCTLCKAISRVLLVWLSVCCALSFGNNGLEGNFTQYLPVGCEVQMQMERAKDFTAKRGDGAWCSQWVRNGIK